ncbi:MAG: hypothetical protein ACOH2L_02860 [Devosia sp.]
MTQIIDHDQRPIADHDTDHAAGFTLYQLLARALRRPRSSQPLPWRLYDDLNIPPCQRPDGTPRLR